MDEAELVALENSAREVISAEALVAAPASAPPPLPGPFPGGSGILPERTPPAIPKASPPPLP
jgi:hypothetical protein